LGRADTRPKLASSIIRRLEHLLSAVFSMLGYRYDAL
jgi:hypothetical protein